MAEDRLLAKYERLWSCSSLTVYSGLSCVKNTKEEWETILPGLFVLGVKYNVILAALFARNIMRDNVWYREKVLEGVCKKMACLQRDEADLKGYLQQVSVLWKALILIMDETNLEQIEELLGVLYNNYLGEREVLTVGKIKNCDFRLSSAVLEPPIDSDVDMSVANSVNTIYPFSDIYICNMYVLRQLVDKDNMAEIEVYHSDLIYLDCVDGFSKKLVKTYIAELLKDGNYKAIACFLHKTVNMDYEDIFGQSQEVFWECMISSESERLADCYLRMSLKAEGDYLDVWKKKVYELVHKPSTLAWCDWAYYWFYLEDMLEQEELAEEDFQEKARTMLPVCEFPFKEAITYNRVTSAVTYIFSEVWERKWNPFRLIDLWGENNLYSYNRRSAYRKSPLGFQNSGKNHNWQAHQIAFWEEPCSEEERLRLYMNSPIRCVIDFRATMIEFVRRMGEEQFGKLMHEYPLEGYMRNIDTLNAAGYLKFEISNHFHSEYRWKNWGKKDKRFYSSLLFNEEAWYRRNELLAKRIKLDALCSFRLCGCYMTGYHDAVLYVDDISSEQLTEESDMQELQRKEMQEALEWMGQIREQKCIIPVHKKSFQNLVPPHKVDMTQKFAEAVFDTVLTLQQNPIEAFRFLGIIHSGRLDKISAYQYLLSRERLFSFRVEGGLGTVWKRIYALYKDRHFTPQQKFNIYMNTYIRCFCGLAEIWDTLKLQESDTINLAARNSEYDRFLFLVDFIGNKNGEANFVLNEGIRMNVGEKNEKYRWCLADRELSDERIGNSFRVSIRDIDTDKKIVWIGQLHEKNIRDRWGTTVRRINDLKDNPSPTHIESVRRAVEKWGMDFRSKNRLEQLLIQYIGHFSLIEKPEYPKEYNLFWCKNILDVFGDKNPFVEPLERPLNISDSDLERMRDGIPSFMQAAYERSIEKGEAFGKAMMEFYECSPYRLICERDAFEKLLTQMLASSL